MKFYIFIIILIMGYYNLYKTTENSNLSNLSFIITLCNYWLEIIITILFFISILFILYPGILGPIIIARVLIVILFIFLNSRKIVRKIARFN